MKPTQLSELLREEDISCLTNGLILTVQPSWIIQGENRLSYTNIFQLIECCREYHWQKDVLAQNNDNFLDSITKSISANFIKPIIVGKSIVITYQITDVKSKGYSIRYIIYEAENRLILTEVLTSNVFYDPLSFASIFPPKKVLKNLNSIRKSDH